MTERSGFDLHIPSSISKKIGPLILSLAAGGLLGGGSMGLTDVFNAKTFIEDKASEIAAAEQLKARVVALEAQQEILMQLVGGTNCEVAP